MNRLLRFAFPGVVLLALAACSSGHADLEQWVARQKAKPGGALPPMPVIKTFPGFTYTDQDLRDPFASAASQAEKSGGKTAASGPRPDPNRPREPLESFALDSLKMKGTVGSGKTMLALLEDSSGVLHHVHDGNYVGKNYGHIVGITQNQINIVELVPNGSGGWREREATIAMSGDKP